MILGQLIEAWRKERGMSLRELAKVIGVDHVSLTRFESGDSNEIKFDNYHKILMWIFSRPPK